MAIAPAPASPATFRKLRRLARVFVGSDVMTLSPEAAPLKPACLVCGSEGRRFSEFRPLGKMASGKVHEL
jgi:hypothetical protein